MPKPRQVTRTVRVTVAHVMICDVEAGDVYVDEFTLPGTYKNDSTMLKIIKKNEETEQLKPVKITGKEEKKVLYGMLESEFLKYAKELPPRKEKKK